MSLSLVGRSAQSVFYAAQVGRYGSPALVLGAADGQLTHALASRGHRVVGVEPSAFLVAEAKGRPGGTRGQVELLQSDLRTLRLAERFPVVLAPHNALALASSPPDLDAVLDTVRHHLLAQGALVFDVSGLRDEPGLEGPFGRPLFSAHFRERSRHGDGDAPAIRRQRRSQWTLPELDAALTGAGFEARERYGDFDGSPWDEGDQLLVVVAGLKEP